LATFQINPANRAPQIDTDTTTNYQPATGSQQQCKILKLIFASFGYQPSVPKESLVFSNHCEFLAGTENKPRQPVQQSLYDSSGLSFHFFNN
jgi:hypothetical protein